MVYVNINNNQWKRNEWAQQVELRSHQPSFETMMRVFLESEMSHRVTLLMFSRPKYGVPCSKFKQSHPSSASLTSLSGVDDSVGMLGVHVLHLSLNLTPSLLIDVHQYLNKPTQEWVTIHSLFRITGTRNMHWSDVSCLSSQSFTSPSCNETLIHCLTCFTRFLYETISFRAQCFKQDPRLSFCLFARLLTYSLFLHSSLFFLVCPQDLVRTIQVFVIWFSWEVDAFVVTLNLRI